jgi:hypothetical protein
MTSGAPKPTAASGGTHHLFAASDMVNINIFGLKANPSIHISRRDEL